MARPTINDEVIAIMLGVAKVMHEKRRDDGVTAMLMLLAGTIREGLTDVPETMRDLEWMVEYLNGAEGRGVDKSPGDKACVDKMLDDLRNGRSISDVLKGMEEWSDTKKWNKEAKEEAKEADPG